MEKIYIKDAHDSYGYLIGNKTFKIRTMALEHLKKELAYINTDSSLQDKYKKAFEAEIERRKRKEVLYEIY